MHPPDTEAEKSLEQLHAELAPAALRFARRYIRRREIAEEITAEAFLKLFQLLRNHAATMPVHEAKSWVFTAVRRMAIDHWRKSRREVPAVLAQQIAAPKLAPFESFDRKLKAYTELKANHRSCLTLRYEFGMERQEIAAQTGLSENQVKSCLQYALRLIRSSL